MAGKAEYIDGDPGACDDQSAVIKFLSDARNYPGSVEKVDRIETHAAIVFLAGDRAYKLKRAVKLPYLDFSTREKRREVIHRELEINSKASPELYISVLPVTRALGEGFELGGSGQPFDWLLIMRRFDNAALLDTVAAKGSLDLALATSLAELVENFHREADVVSEAGFFETIKHIVADLESVLCREEARAKGLRLEHLIKLLHQQCGKHKTLIEQRQSDGFVRRCHGDLHLGNIVLWEDAPKLFDAIEFDDRLATIDVLYDLAFLLMDLWNRGLKRQANAILNHYFLRAGVSELQGLALLPLFLSLRSAIRAMTGLQALTFQAENTQKTSLNRIKGYATLASQVLTWQRPYLIAIGGLSGTGKSSVAREIAPAVGAVPGALHLRTDVERKIMHGVAFDHKLSATAYSAENRAEVYRRLFEKTEAALASGHSVIVDAVFADAPHRASLRDIAQRTNAAFRGFWLQTNPSLIRERISTRGRDASDAGVSVFDEQLASIVPPPDWKKIDVTGTIVASTAMIFGELSIAVSTGG